MCRLTRLPAGILLNVVVLPLTVSRFESSPRGTRPGSFSVPTGMITAHQLYNYITDHANTYSMKPVRMSKTACTADGKKGAPSAEQHEYALVALWNRLLRRRRPAEARWVARNTLALF